jgi:chemotaxis protein CheD
MPSSTSPGRLRAIGPGQILVSSDPTETLITYGLGSSIAVTAYDRVARVGALMHAELTLGPACDDEAQRSPAMFVESGVAYMLAALRERGARQDRLELRAAGAARLTSGDAEACFGIGRRNVVALKKVLWQHGVLIRAYEVGGAAVRTLSLRIEDGMVELSTPTTGRALGGDLTWF